MRLTLIFILLIFNSIALRSQSFNDCFGYIKENKLKEAIDCLEELQKNNAYKADASVCLSMLKAERRDLVAAFDDFKRFYRVAPNPYPFLYALSGTDIFTVSGTAYGKEVFDFLSDIHEKSSTDVTTRLLVTDLASAKAMSYSGFADLRALYSDAGVLSKWSVAGVFENISSSGFSKKNPTLSNPAQGSVFTNKYGTNVTWFDIAGSGNDAWINLKDHFDVKNSIVYAQTFVNSDRDKDVTLKAGVCGSLKIWVNDFLVGEEDEERNTLPDAYSYHVKLKKGANRILLQVGCSEQESSKFVVRICDEKNGLITDLVHSGAYATYAIDTGYTVKKDAFFAERYFEDLLKKDRNNFLYKLLLLQVYERNEKKFASYQLLAELKNEAPNCTIVSELAIKLGKSDNNKLLIAQEQESIKKNDPDSYAALVLKCDEAMDRQSWGEAINIAERAMSQYTQDELVCVKYMAALLFSDQLQRALEACERAEKKFPNSPVITSFKHLWIANSSHDLKASTQMLISSILKRYSRQLVEIIIDNFLTLGNKEGAKKQYALLLSNYPTEKELYRNYAYLINETGDFAEALAMCDSGLKIAPYDGSLHFVKAVVLTSLGKKDEAKTAFERSIMYDPSNLTSRAKLSKLTGSPSPMEYIVSKDINALYTRGQKDERYKDENAVILLNDRVKIVYPGGGPQMDLTESLILIKSATAIDQLKELNLDYNNYSQKISITKAEVLKKDGSIVPAERKGAHCVFTSLSVGDAVHVAYTLESTYEGALAGHFWDKYYFDGLLPVDQASYTLVAPRDMKFEHKMVNAGSIIYSQKDSNEYSIYTWKATDLARFIPEISIHTSPMQTLLISSMPDWKYVRSWYDNLSTSKIQADFSVVEQTRQTVSGVKKNSELEKARAIYSFIENNFHYISVPFIQSALMPQRASKTLRSRMGDCKDLSSLFVSMARSEGLKANLVLVSANNRDSNEFVLPTIDFNHCIVHFVADKKDYYLEMTNNNLPFAASDISLTNAIALDIAPKAAQDSLLRIPRSSCVNNCNLRMSKMAFEGKELKMNRTVVKTGSQVAYLSQGYKESTASLRTDMLQREIALEFKKDVQLTVAKFPSFERVEDTATLQYDFAVGNFLTDVAGMSIFSIPWTEANHLTQCFSTDKRTYAEDMLFYSTVPVNTETITITLPKGRKLVEQPKDVVISNALFNYSVKFNVVGEQIKASRQLTFLKDVIQPNEYPGIREAVKRVNEADGMQFAIK